MPIRKREPDIFPDDLLEGDAGYALGQDWWVLHTKPRQEKVLMSRLRERKMAHYCPLIAKRFRTPKGRVFTSYIPFFPGYVFLCGNDEVRYHALTTNCVAQCLKVPDAGELVGQLRDVRLAIASGLPILPETRIEPGIRVRIRSGPLAGIEGMVVSRHGENRFIIMVSFIQQGASILLDSLDIEPVECSMSGSAR